LSLVNAGLEHISDRVIILRAKEAGLMPCVAEEEFFLTPQHANGRIQFCNRYADRGPQTDYFHFIFKSI